MSRSRKAAMLSVSFAGLVVAALSGAQTVHDFLNVLCYSSSGGCVETVKYRFLWLPVWQWGLIFYGAVVVFLLAAERYAYLFVAAGFGAELVFVWIMIAEKIGCLLCLINLAIMVALLLLSIDRGRVLKVAALCVGGILFAILGGMPQHSAIEAASATTKNKGVAAVIDGVVISEDELEAPLAAQLYRLRSEIYELKRKRLDDILAEFVLKREAERRGISVGDFIKQEIVPVEPEVSDAEIDKYLSENQEKLKGWQGSQADLRQQVRNAIQRQHVYEKTISYAKMLEAKSDLVVYLEEPPLPHVNVALGDSPAMGPVDAPVTIVEYSDYRCPSCRLTHETVKELRRHYKEKIRWVFKDYALGGSAQSIAAAEAAHCAGDQGAFWEYQELLFGINGNIGRKELIEQASRLRLNVESFQSCLDSAKYRPRVIKDMQEALNLGIDRTPSFIVNGKLVAGGPPVERFKEIIDREINSAGAKKGLGD